MISDGLCMHVISAFTIGVWACVTVQLCTNFTNGMFQLLLMRATGSVATEQPHPMRPTLGTLL